MCLGVSLECGERIGVTGKLVDLARRETPGLRSQRRLHSVRPASRAATRSPTCAAVRRSRSWGLFAYAVGRSPQSNREGTSWSNLSPAPPFSPYRWRSATVPAHPGARRQMVWRYPWPSDRARSDFPRARQPAKPSPSRSSPTGYPKGMCSATSPAAPTAPRCGSPTTSILISAPTMSAASPRPARSDSTPTARCFPSWLES
jgi:hypothetical protein